MTAEIMTMNAITKTAPASKARAAKTREKPAQRKPASAARTGRDYAPASATTRDDLERVQENTFRAIAGLEAEMASIEKRAGFRAENITETAEFEIAEIDAVAANARALVVETRDRELASVNEWKAAEIRGREDHVRELEKRLEMVTNGIGHPAAPERGFAEAGNAVTRALEVVK